MESYFSFIFFEIIDEGIYNGEGYRRLREKGIYFYLNMKGEVANHIKMQV